MDSASSRLVRWLPALAWMAFIFVLSAQPGLRFSSDDTVEGPLRHVVHMAMYGVLGVLFVHALDGRGRPALLLLAVVLTSLYGVTDEIHQSFVPERNGNLLDVGLDILGGAVGVAVLALLPVLRRRRA